MKALPGEMTIDQLAARAGMTVRNVRAYASRGLLPAPRLVGRTGYYDEQHAARLQLIRDLIDRGYTLTAVEKALSDGSGVADSHALELLTLLSNPLGSPVEPEEMSVAELVELAGTEHDEEFLDQLAALGLIERLDPETIRVLRPVLVRAGARAMQLGISRPRLLGLLEQITTATRSLSTEFVHAYRDDVWRPFVAEGLPGERWPDITGGIESLLPIVSQAVLAAFRRELTLAIEDALGEELASLDPEQIGRLLSDG